MNNAKNLDPERSGQNSKRKNPSKRLRFEVFKRDRFTCQYCGAQPPGVVLVCDHIDPVALGGATTIDNLITACETCNQGKAAKPLGQVAVRPDADLMYLEMQQEIAELRRYQEATRERDELLTSLAEDIRLRVADQLEIEWAPATKYVIELLQKYSPDVVETSVSATCKAYERGKFKGRPYIPYLRKVAKTVAEETESDISQEEINSHLEKTVLEFNGFLEYAREEDPFTYSLLNSHLEESIEIGLRKVKEGEISFKGFKSYVIGIIDQKIDKQVEEEAQRQAANSDNPSKEWRAEQ